MTVPFMRAYTERIVSICHRHRAYAIGGMAAYIPNRRDPEAYQRAIDGVRADKVREAGDGFDGTWVAHPDLVNVGLEVFDGVLGERANQLERTRDDVEVSAADLIDLRVPDAQVTEAGLRGNIDVAVRYTASWLAGTGAVALNNLMEDAATAEISRSQVWQWVRHGARLAEGGTVTRDLVTSLFAEERAALAQEAGSTEHLAAQFEQAASLIESLVLSEDCPPFLTLPAYDLLEGGT
jgi:malate synthase